RAGRRGAQARGGSRHRGAAVHRRRGCAPARALRPAQAPLRSSRLTLLAGAPMARSTFYKRWLDIRDREGIRRVRSRPSVTQRPRWQYGVAADVGLPEAELQVLSRAVSRTLTPAGRDRVG